MRLTAGLLNWPIYYLFLVYRSVPAVYLQVPIQTGGHLSAFPSALSTTSCERQMPNSYWIAYWENINKKEDPKLQDKKSGRY